MAHILLIEDNPGDALLIREMYKDADAVSNKYVITHVTRVSQAIALLKTDNDIDLILSDMSLPDSQGLETLDSLTHIASELPVIFMTGTNNEAFVSAAINAGAQDYLVKGSIDSQVLIRTTAYSIERKKAQRKFDTVSHSAKLLKQQKDQLITLSRAKDEFISLASHQLRTPATAVKQYIAMIKDGYAGSVPAKIKPYLDTAYAANERQLDIINDLLRAAQLDSGNYKLEKTSEDICTLVREVLDEYSPVTTMRKQAVSYEHTGECLSQIDASELKIAIGNLLENASKYSPENSMINVAIKNNNKNLIISVSDQGVGINQDDVHKIFDKFTRLDNELSDTVNGSGLGLYFVKKIAKLHNGKVQVKSQLHKGSTFSLVLPA